MMPMTQDGLPFSGSTAISRHCSFEAARAAARTRGVKTLRYLDWLREVGVATDPGAAEHFSWPLSSICSIRNHCVDLGLVEAWDSCEGRHGKRITLWRARP